jgi:hypothetical protein
MVLHLACRGSPTSQKVTFELLQRGAHLSLDECLAMEAHMVGWSVWVHMILAFDTFKVTMQHIRVTICAIPIHRLLGCA